MATANPPPGAAAVEDYHGSDPFVTSSQDAHRQRYAAFDNSQFSLYLNGSPAQAKRALQAHLAETTRRLQETSHLGNALVQQRKELEEKLKEVDQEEEAADIGPELRYKLAELEKEFHEVGRETARAFLPKSRVPSGETDAAAGASVYTSEAQHSPTKISVPSRRQRNQQPSRIHDVTLATEISTSLLAQLKDLQAVLLEKDDALKATNLDRSQLEIELEGLSQRLRTLDESESRLKDVNWNLETQVRDFETQSKTAADKEHRLNHNVNTAKSEKAILEREFEELKQLYAKVGEDHVSRAKQHEMDLSGLRRNVSMGESERSALQRKVDELASQNQELAQAIASRMRFDEQASAEDISPDEGAGERDNVTPDQSPPPSPTKATPRHGQLESETLKHSLHHAHRMIQQLKNNIHREKTEKIELKRLLQDARDQAESRTAQDGPGSASKRRKNDKDVFKKPPRPDRLGALRTGSQEVVVDDDDWEEHEGAPNTPSRRSRQVDAVPGAFPGGYNSAVESSATEGFETANETSDAAFETANERDGIATETDSFQTGAETLDGDSSADLTETEAGPTDTVHRRPTSLAMAGHRDSYESTASTSGEDWDADEIRTPVQSQHPRYRLKVRQGHRRSTPRASQEIYPDTPPAARESPGSFISNSNDSTPAQGKSLMAELGSLSAGESEDGSVADGTPSRSGMISPESSPEALRKPALGRSPLQVFGMPRPPMIDSSTMTESLEATPTQNMAMSSIAALDTHPKATPHPSLQMTILTGQATTPQPAYKPSLLRSALSSQVTVPQLTPPSSLNMAAVSAMDTTPHAPMPLALHMSTVSAQGTDPHSPHRPSLLLSNHSAQWTEPDLPEAEQSVVKPLTMSSIERQTTEPVDMHVSKALASTMSARNVEPVEVSSRNREAESMTTWPPLTMASLSSQSTVPSMTPQPPPLNMSDILSQGTEPAEVTQPARHLLSAVSSLGTEPVAASRPHPQLSMLSSLTTVPLQSPRAATSQLSAHSHQTTSPIEILERPTSRISSVAMQHSEPIEPTLPPRPLHRFSDVTILHDTQPESPTLPVFLPNLNRPSTANRVAHRALALSSIVSTETEPDSSSRPTTAQRTVPIPTTISTGTVQTEDHRRSQLDATNHGFFSSVISWGKTIPKETLVDAAQPSSREGRMPLAAISNNAVQGEREQSNGRSPFTEKSQAPTLDEGTQTMVSADQIDRLLLARSQRHSGTIAAADIEKQMSPPASPSRRNSDPSRTPRRPGSSSSIRSRAADAPPLPPDHREVIAAASLKSPTTLSVPTTPGVMGPPMIPASAYKKRPQTPIVKTTNTAPGLRIGGTTPRPRRSSQTRSGAASPITRRSSVSSFTSEIDYRFNIPGGPSWSQAGLDPSMSTDPRMIQAITQTMIGEFLWKYTRKPGREGMSEKRHRRFFWVHPYTRTLYWSDQDPATAGRAQLKAKSVAIEAVHQVTDENPYPPGLHQQSLVVVTPGRTVKFTATTSQRHETWRNALLYLLRRTDDGGDEQRSEASEIQNEFNPGFRSTSRQTGRSRISHSTYTSHRTSSPHHAQIPTLRQPAVTPNRPVSTEPSQGSVSGRFSTMLRSTSGMRGSFSSRFSKASAQESITYEEPNSSAADLSRELVESSERAGNGLVDVRACCDGKHHLHQLHHHGVQSRNSSYAGNPRPSLIGSMSSRSHSRAESIGRKDRNDQDRHQADVEAQGHAGG